MDPLAPVELTHYLINFVGHGPAVEANTLAVELGKGMAAAGVDLLMASSYISKLGADPYKLGLADNWRKIQGKDRQKFITHWPELALCLDLLTDVRSGDSE
ncbi:MAG: hypothetical protein AB7V39_26170 [Nitrospiraceae bacterium]